MRVYLVQKREREIINEKRKKTCALDYYKERENVNIYFFPFLDIITHCSPPLPLMCKLIKN